MPSLGALLTRSEGVPLGALVKTIYEQGLHEPF